MGAFWEILHLLAVFGTTVPKFKFQVITQQEAYQSVKGFQTYSLH